MVWSSGVTPAAVRRTRTRPSATTGLGRSTSFKPPYPVNESARMALISTPPLQIGDAHLDRPGSTAGSARNGLSRPPRDLSLDAHGARPSKRSAKLVDGLGWRRFIDTLFLPVETSGGGRLDSAVRCRWIG